MGGESTVLFLEDNIFDFIKTNNTPYDSILDIDQNQALKI